MPHAIASSACCSPLRGQIDIDMEGLTAYKLHRACCILYQADAIVNHTLNIKPCPALPCPEYNLAKMQRTLWLYLTLDRLPSDFPLHIQVSSATTSNTSRQTYATSPHRPQNQTDEYNHTMPTSFVRTTIFLSQMEGRSPQLLREVIPRHAYIRRSGAYDPTAAHHQSRPAARMGRVHSTPLQHALRSVPLGNSRSSELVPYFQNPVRSQTACNLFRVVMSGVAERLGRR